MGQQNKIEVILSAKDTGFSSGISQATKGLKSMQDQIQAAMNESKNLGGGLNSIRSQVLQLAGAFAGLSAIADIGSMLKQADQNAYSLTASIKAANREFEVGSAGDWEKTISELSTKLRIYSESDIRGATARTIDMTKRLGLNAEQMKRVIELSGDLAAGRTDLEGGVERVTAAIRGEAEAAEFLGLTLNETYVKSWIAAHDAHAKAWKDMNDLEKAQVRYQVFLEQAIPLQGKAAASINTWSGALAYVRKEVADSIGNNADLAASLQQVGNVLRDNGPALGELASQIATAAASVIQFTAENRELLLTVAKYGLTFNLAFNAISKLALTWVGLNKVIAAMTGLQIIPWLRNVEAATIGTVTAVTGLKGGFISLMAASAAFFSGYKFGEWLTMREHIQGVTQAQAELRTATSTLAQKFREVSMSTGMTITSMEQLDDLVREGKVHYDQLTGTWKSGAAEQQAATKQTASVMGQVTGEALEAMKKKYQEYAQQVRQIQEQIVGRERSLAAELRAMGRSGMSESSAWKDQKKEAEEYAKAAKQAAEEAQRALNNGDTITADQKFKEAVQMADEAKQAYKQLNTEVTQNGQVMVSKQQALQTAMDGVRKSGELAIDILKKQKDAAAQSMDGLIGESGFVDLTEGMDKAEKQWLANWKNMEDFAGKQILYVKERLDALENDRYVTVWVTEKVARSTGGKMYQLSSGAKLPGFGGGDKIDASLEAGEMVINKFATRAIGDRASYAWNNQQWGVVLEELVKKVGLNAKGRIGYSLGGVAGTNPGISTSDTINLNLTMPGSARAIPLKIGREHVNQLMRESARMHRLRS